MTFNPDHSRLRDYKCGDFVLTKPEWEGRGPQSPLQALAEGVWDNIEVEGQLYSPGVFLGWGNPKPEGWRWNPMNETEEDFSDPFVVRVLRVDGRVDVIFSGAIRWNVTGSELISMAVNTSLILKERGAPNKDVREAEAHWKRFCDFVREHENAQKCRSMCSKCRVESLYQQIKERIRRRFGRT